MPTDHESFPQLPYRWPPRIFFNTDGCLVFKYLCRRNADDVTEMMVPLADTCVDVVCALVGINDDLSWRGSPHGELWGESMGMDIGEVLPDGDSSPLPSLSEVRPQDLLQMNMRTIVDDGHDVFQLYVDRARQTGLGIYASFRMNDAHCNMEHRMGDAKRSPKKMERPDLLLGSPPPANSGHAATFNFCWQWDYAQEEVRQRFLGLFDETLGRYDVDGLELDFCRHVPLFKPHQGFKHVETMTMFLDAARQVAARHAQEKGRDIKVMCRTPSSFYACLELGLDAETWIREGIVDIIAISSGGGWRSENDVSRAVAAAKTSGTLVYAGSGGTYPASPLNGYENGQPAVRRAIALNAYQQGAAGVHLFNHDYANHRAMPVAPGDESDMPEREYPPIYQNRVGAYASDRFTHKDLQTMRDLGDPDRLKRLDRCYHLASRSPLGDYEPQLPRKLCLIGRGASTENALRLQVEDDVEGGLAEGRIVKTELRLRLTQHEKNLARIICHVNDQPVDLTAASTIASSQGEEWLVVDNPPVRQGMNTVLVVLEGTESPDGWELQGSGVGEGWPTLHQCELLLRCE